MVIFNTGLNDFSRKYLIKKSSAEERGLAATFAGSYSSATNQLLEQLLLFDKVSIKVYGENIPLTILINILGLNSVLELLERDVLEFVLWTPMLTTMESDDLVGVAAPLQSGALNSPVHCVPEDSVHHGLKFLRKNLDRGTRRTIQKAAAKAYKVPRETIPHSAADIVISAYSDNKLASVGLPKEKEANLLLHDERMRLLSVADDVLETAILAEYQYSSFGKYLYYDIAKSAFESIRSATGVVDSSAEILRVERLPDVSKMVSERKISAGDILRLRKRPNAKKYRQWLEQQALAGADGDSILKEYIDEIANRKGFFETTKGKFVKIMGMYGIGIAAGAAADGVTGALKGAAITGLIKPAAELGLSAIDSYLLEGLLKGWTPKLFINEYQTLASRLPST